MDFPLNTQSLILSLACGSAVLLSLYALKAGWRFSAHRLFAAGMLILCVETALGGMALVWGVPFDPVHWFRIRNVVSSLVPGVWLLFALALGAQDFRHQLMRKRWLVLTVLILPPLSIILFPDHFFRGELLRDTAGSIFIRLGWAGYTYHSLFVLGIVALMVVLEYTLRSSRGVKRWQVKFLALGILGFFAVRIYSSSQMLLFHFLDFGVEVMLPAAALILANFLIAATFIRSKVLPEDIYLSGELIRRSLVLFLVGGYLVITGLMAKVLFILGEPLSFNISSFFVFALLVLLAAILFSDRLRFTLKRFVSRHFERPRYDYRDVWMKFTERTSSAEDVRDLGNRTVSMISEMLEILTVNLWLFRAMKDNLILSGSTAISGDSPGFNNRGSVVEIELLKLVLSGRRRPFDFSNSSDFPDLREFGKEHQAFLDRLGMRYCAPLWVGEDLLGFIALDDRVGTAPLNLEDLDLLGTIADQAAAGIQNLQLSEKLQLDRETQTLRKFSAFFIHDLKNVASKLSMMLQNFPVHYDKPEFREDALALVSQTVEKINLLTSRMSKLREAPEIRPEHGCLSETVRASLSEIDLPPGVTIHTDYGSVNRAEFDPEALSRVVTNLVLNAVEAVLEAGAISVRTFDRKGWAVLEVRDDGAGIEEEFMSHSLFQPFKTTKEKGLGIGLFQCQALVKAHDGYITVESRPGEGAAFQVHIPNPGRDTGGTPDG